jgi:hypothetical protein
MKFEGARERTKVKDGRAARLPTPLGYDISIHHYLPKEWLMLWEGFAKGYPRMGWETRVPKTK